MWDVTTRPGEEPQVHVHETEDEIFYLIAGSMTFRCGDMAFDVQDHGFVYVPRGTPHTYTIHSNEARLLGLSTPSTFGDNIERTGIAHD